MQLVLLSGVSGSGKSVALRALEDAGYFCVDNLPADLIAPLVDYAMARGEPKVAISADARSRESLGHLPDIVDKERVRGNDVRVIFLDANDESLVRRFSETRRPHPLSKGHLGTDTHRALIEAIELERELLAGIRVRSTILDTSQLRPVQLRRWVRDLVGAHASQLSLVFESFAFKRGVPLDADMVFDVRVLPNPYYLRELRPLNGRDIEVATYLRAQPEVMEMLDQIETFLRRWLPNFEDDQRSYLTVAIGCTGGQHRSVFMAETLAQRFGASVSTLVRHRELDTSDAA